MLSFSHSCHRKTNPVHLRTPQSHSYKNAYYVPGTKLNIVNKINKVSALTQFSLVETIAKEQVITTQYGKKCDGENLEQCVSQRRGTSLPQGFEEGFPGTARKNYLNEEEESILAEVKGHGRSGGKKAM